MSTTSKALLMPSGLTWVPSEQLFPVKPRGVLITGGAGFLGNGLARRLLADGCDRVCIFSRGEHAQARMRAAFGDDSRLRWFIGDVRDKDRLRWAMRSCDHVIAAAALKRIEVGKMNPTELVKTNVVGAMNTVEAALETGVDRVVFVSSDKAYQPVSPYGQSKAIGESIFLEANNGRGSDGTKFACCRYGNVWRSSGSVVPTWTDMILAGAEEVPITDPEATRFFMTRDEAVDLVLGTLRTMKGGELAIPDLPAYRLGDVAEAMKVRTRVVGMMDWEKKHESMRDGLTSDTARRMSVDELRNELA